MALLGNYSVIHKSPATFTGGLSIAQTRSNYDKSGSIKNSYLHFGLLASYPSGYSAPYSWSMAREIGSMTALINSNLVIVNGALAKGINVDSSMSATLSVTNAQLDALIDLLSSISASGSIGAVEVQVLNNIAVSISSTMTVTNADIQTLAIALIESNINGTLSISNAALGSLISLSSNPSANGSLTVITDILVNITCDIGGPAPLSPEGLAEAVWSKDLSSYSDPLSAGKKLNDLGAGANPWDVLTSSSNTPGTFGALVQKLLTVAKFLGLK